MAVELSKDPLAGALGEVCIVWFLIETQVGLLLEEVIWAALHGKVTPSLKLILNVMIQNMELRQRTQTVKAIAVGFESPEFSQVETLMNKIDNELRNGRNRYMHDYWVPEGEGFVRVKPGSFIKWEQARTPKALMGKQEEFPDIEAVRKLGAKMGEALGQLREFIEQFRLIRQQRLSAVLSQQGRGG